MPIRSVEDFAQAQEYLQDPNTPPDKADRLRKSMQAFEAAQRGEVDLSSLQAERDAAPGGDIPELPPVGPGEGGRGAGLLEKSRPLAGAGMKVAPPRLEGAKRSLLHSLPSHIPFIGGDVEQKVDPSFEEFLRQRGDTLRQSMPTSTFNEMASAGTRSPEYQAFADELWNAEVAKAKTEGRTLQRLKAEMGSTYEPDAGLGTRASEMAGQFLDASVGAAAAAADTGAAVLPGAGTALSALGGKDFANDLRQRSERHPVASTLGGIAGSLAPQSAVNLAASGASRGLSALAGKALPNAGPALSMAGRTGGAALVGGAGSVAQGAGQDLANEFAFDETPESGAMMRRFVEGAAAGGGLHLAGEGANAVAAATRDAHPEISGAEKIGVRPGITGLKAAENSPARKLEAQRIATGDESLEHVAAKNVAPGIQDSAARMNQQVLDQSKGETAAAYHRLGGSGKGGGLPRPEEVRARNTLPPGPADRAADAFGQEARNTNEFKASLNNLQRTVGSPTTSPEPIKVSTAPIAQKLMDIIDEQHVDPATGRTMPFFNDADLRAQLPNIIDVKPMSLEEAAARSKSEGGWVVPLEKFGMAETPGQVAYVKPIELDAPHFDALVEQLQNKANLDNPSRSPDKRYGQLAAVATEARGGFPGLNELNQKQAERFTKTRNVIKGAGVQPVREKSVPEWKDTEATSQEALTNAVADYKRAGRSAGATRKDPNLRTIAKFGGIEADLEKVPAARDVDELRRTMSPGGIPGSQSGAIARLARSGLVRANPTLTALGGTPQPGEELKAIAQALSPRLKEVLRQMRRDAKPSLGMGALTSKIGLRGGVAGARAATVKQEYDQLTREDLENLVKLKQAASASEDQP